MCLLQKFITFEATRYKILQECFNLDLIIGDNVWSLLYFMDPQTKIMLTLSYEVYDPFLTVVFGNYNAKCQTRCRSNKTSYEGSRLDILT